MSTDVDITPAYIHITVNARMKIGTTKQMFLKLTLSFHIQAVFHLLTYRYPILGSLNGEYNRRIEQDKELSYFSNELIR